MSLILTAPAPLYLGAFEDAVQAGPSSFRRVLSAVSSPRQTPRGSGSFRLPVSWQALAFHHLSVADSVSTDTLLHGLDAAVEFLLDVPSDEAAAPTLVHCQQGVSRSAAVLLAYLMLAAALPLCDAAALLHAARPVVCPNEGFLTQLHCLDRLLASTAPAPAACDPVLAPAPLLRLLRVACARTESGRPCDGFDAHARGAFVTCPGWAPRQLCAEELAALRATAGDALARARATYAATGAAPARVAHLLGSRGDAEHEWWFDCGRCNARLLGSGHVILPAGAARVLHEGAKPRPQQQQRHHHHHSHHHGSGAAAAVATVPLHSEGGDGIGSGSGGGDAGSMLVEPLVWMLALGGQAAAAAGGGGDDDDEGEPHEAEGGGSAPPSAASSLQPPAAAACPLPESAAPQPPSAAARRPAPADSLRWCRAPTRDEVARGLVAADGGGKLACPACAHRVGSWSWHCTLELLRGGAQESGPGGVLVTLPAFRVSAARTIRRRGYGGGDAAWALNHTRF